MHSVPWLIWSFGGVLCCRVRPCDWSIETCHYYDRVHLRPHLCTWGIDCAHTILTTVYDIMHNGDMVKCFITIVVQQEEIYNMDHKLRQAVITAQERFWGSQLGIIVCILRCLKVMNIIKVGVIAISEVLWKCRRLGNFRLWKVFADNLSRRQILCKC
jgi:hypothetical protein